MEPIEKFSVVQNWAGESIERRQEIKGKLIVAFVVTAFLSFGLSRNHSEAANETVTSDEYQVLIEGGLSPNVKQLNDAGAQDGNW